MKDGDKFACICKSTFSSMPSIYATISQKHFLNLPFHKTFFYISRFKSWKSFVWNALKHKSLLVVRHFCLEHARGAWRDLLLVTRPFSIALGITCSTFFGSSNLEQILSFWATFDIKQEKVNDFIEHFNFFNCFQRSSRARSARSGAPWVSKCGKLPIRENLVIAWPYINRPTNRESVRTTGIPM